MTNNNIGFGTKAIHAGETRAKDFQALTMPIYQTSTFYFNTCEEGGKKFRCPLCKSIINYNECVTVNHFKIKTN